MQATHKLISIVAFSGCNVSSMPITITSRVGVSRRPSREILFSTENHKDNTKFNSLTVLMCGHTVRNYG